MEEITDEARLAKNLNFRFFIFLRCEGFYIEGRQNDIWEVGRLGDGRGRMGGDLHYQEARRSSALEQLVV